MSVKTKRLRNTEAFQMLSRYRRQRMEEMGLPYITDSEGQQLSGRCSRLFTRALTAAANEAKEAK